MGYRRTPFAPGEWYHCFSRGVDKRTIFETEADYRRFLQLLYLSNSANTIERGRIQHLSHSEIFSVPRGEPFVSVGVYTLMKNHPHLLLQEKVEGGITKFLHKVFTGYTMYFNIKRKRIGNLLITPFRSKHITDDRYLRRCVQYIHVNFAEIVEPGWKEGRVSNLQKLEKKLLSYPYSSAQDYFSEETRPEKALLDPETFELIRGRDSFSEMLAETQLYYQELNGEFGS